MQKESNKKSFYMNKFVFVNFLQLIALLYVIIIDFSNKYLNDKNIASKNSSLYYDNLFNSIESDNYNISLIFDNPYNTIKIKYFKNKKNIFNEVKCVFGILVNEKGIYIASSMMEWLLQEYDIYCVYQKYPGSLFEYPALRFAQWISLTLHIEIVLYLHTKGAFYHNENQDKVIELWKNEFTNERKNLYINLIKNNLSDVTLPFKKDKCTWYNGMFISKRAFSLINTIGYNPNDRWYYESLFFYTHNNIRIKGILDDNIPPYKVLISTIEFLNYVKKRQKRLKLKYIKFILFTLFLIIIFFKMKLITRKNIYIKI